MARVTAAQWLQKWGTNLSSAGTAIQNGISNVKTAPGVSAAAAADRMLAGVQKALADGTWQKNVSAITLQQWQDSMVKKGIPRLAQGISQAQATKSASVQAMLSAVDAAVSDANAIPRGNLEQNIQRAAAFARSMSARAPKRNR